MIIKTNQIDFDQNKSITLKNKKTAIMKKTLRIAPVSEVHNKDAKPLEIIRDANEFVQVRTAKPESFTRIRASEIKREEHFLILNNQEYLILELENSL